jgi:hypothetical protein
MKALILNGARSGNGAVNTMNAAIMAALAEEGWQAESLPCAHESRVLRRLLRC